MKIFCVSLVLFLCGFFANAQIFPDGTNAIHKDSSIIVSWAVSANVERGYINIADTSLTYTEGGTTSNKAFFGIEENAIGAADGNFVSLGDGGSVVLQFDSPITNGQGPDFAVFENAIFSPPTQFELAFVELAFVEVSTNGIDYERFPAVSNQQYHTQITSFQASDISLFTNFAGIYPVFYGVPFDLDDIPGVLVDKNNINYVRIVDAVGNINPEFASYDSQGNIVNDPYPTAFASCGFDLDAVGVINQSLNISNLSNIEIDIYPNPFKESLKIVGNKQFDLLIFDLHGSCVFETNNSSEILINTSYLEAGYYVAKIYSDNTIITKKLIKIE